MILDALLVVLGVKVFLGLMANFIVRIVISKFGVNILGINVFNYYLRNN